MINKRAPLGARRCRAAPGGVVAAWRWRGLFDPLALTGLIGGNPAAPLAFLVIHIAAACASCPRTLWPRRRGWSSHVGGVVWAALGSVPAVAAFLTARYIRSGFVERADPITAGRCCWRGPSAAAGAALPCCV